MPVLADPTLLWVLLTVFLFVILFILVPWRLIKAYLPCGLLLGTGQAVIIVWLFQFNLNFWQLTGDPVILGFTTLLTPIAWIAPTIVFAAYFPEKKYWYYIAAYVLLFAVGAMVAQVLLEQAGMWQSIRWNPLFTAMLATFTHSVLTIGLLATRARVS